MVVSTSMTTIFCHTDLIILLALPATTILYVRSENVFVLSGDAPAFEQFFTGVLTGIVNSVRETIYCTLRIDVLTIF